MKPIDWLIRHVTLPVILSMSISATGYCFFGSYHQRLKQAVKTENIDNLNSLLSKSNNNIKSLEKFLEENGETFLTHAITLENEQIALSFINAKVLINHPNFKKVMPIEVAIEHDKSKLVENLLKAGANIDANENTKAKVIHYLFKINNTELISTFVAQQDLNILDEAGNTPLMTAMKNGHKTIVRSKLSPKIAINQVSDNQETLLGLVLETHDLAMFETLLSLKVNINQETRFNTLEGKPVLPPLTYGIVVEDYNLVEKIVNQAKFNWNLSTDIEETYVNTAARLGRNQILRFLIRRGANYRQPDKQGNTPLINACKGNHEKIAKQLIALGADVNFHNLEGRTAISYAIETGSESIVERLLNAHADLGERDYLYYAVVNNSHLLAKKLLDVGADPNLKAAYPNFLSELSEPQLSTPLYHAIETEDTQMVKILLSYEQTDLTIKNYNDNHSYLNRACHIGNAEISKLLLEKETILADLEHADMNGDTPLLNAANKGSLEIVRLLLEKGADINHTNEKGLNVFSITKAKQPKIFAFLNYYQAKLDGNLQDIEEYFTNSKTEQDLNELFNLLLKKYNDINGYLLSDHLVSLIDSIQNYDLLLYLKGLLKTYTRLDDSRNDYLTKRLNLLMVEKWESILDQEGDTDFSNYANLERNVFENDCSICTRPAKKGKTYYGPADCTHVTCKKCFHKHMEQKLSENESEPLTCPTCKDTLSTDFISNLDIDHEDISKLRLQQIKKRLKANKKFRFCPTPGCLGGKIVQNQDDQFYSCPICDFEGNITGSSKQNKESSVK